MGSSEARLRPFDTFRRPSTTDAVGGPRQARLTREGSPARSQPQVASRHGSLARISHDDRVRSSRPGLRRGQAAPAFAESRFALAALERLPADPHAADLLRSLLRKASPTTPGTSNARYLRPGVSCEGTPGTNPAATRRTGESDTRWAGPMTRWSSGTPAPTRSRPATPAAPPSLTPGCEAPSVVPDRHGTWASDLDASPRRARSPSDDQVRAAPADLACGCSMRKRSRAACLASPPVAKKRWPGARARTATGNHERGGERSFPARVARGRMH
jgi:hypothetical protein